MTEARYQFGRVASIRASAVGQPGQRRFRLLVGAVNGASALVWMDKQQLFNLGVALKNLIEQVHESHRRGRQTGVAGRFAARADSSDHVEFQAGHMAVGYDEESDLYLFLANEVEEPEGSLPRLSILADQQAMNALADEAFEVCSAGRPLCPLCGTPINANEAHVCPKHNGYHASLGETRELS